MNQDLENKLPGAESDPMVSAEYQATATERTPPALDTAVLNKAEATAKESGLQGFTAFWLRPLAFVATLGLALALVLELTNIETLQPAMDAGFEAGHQDTESLPAVPSGDADNLKTERYDRRDSAAGKPRLVAPPAPAQGITPKVDSGRRQRPEPAPHFAAEIEAFGLTDSANAPVENESVSADHVETMEASPNGMQESEHVTETATQSLSETRGIEKVQAGKVSAYMQPLVTIGPCTEEQVAVPEIWWQCISDLNEAGQHIEAKAELDLFNKAHPDFEAPEILPSQ